MPIMPKVKTQIAGLLISVIGAAVMVRGVDVPNCRRLTRTFFRQPVSAQIEKFREYDLAKQYDIYLCGTQSIHPPATYLAEPIARQGGRAVTVLKAKLAEARSDHTIRDLLFVFDQMQALGSYDVHSDQELMKVISDAEGRLLENDRRLKGQSRR
jgi:hypothetical protein